MHIIWIIYILDLDFEVKLQAIVSVGIVSRIKLRYWEDQLSFAKRMLINETNTCSYLTLHC